MNILIWALLRTTGSLYLSISTEHFLDASISLFGQPTQLLLQKNKNKLADKYNIVGIKTDMPTNSDTDEIPHLQRVELHTA